MFWEIIWSFSLFLNRVITVSLLRISVNQSLICILAFILLLLLLLLLLFKFLVL